MNAGLRRRALRETWLPTLSFGLALLTFQVVIAIVLPTFFSDMAEQFLQLPFIRNMVRALLGPVGDNIDARALASFAWVHPVVLALLWAHAIILATRVPAGEIDRGTIDVLLALPVSRWQLYTVEAVVLLGSGVVVVALTLTGNVFGSTLAPQAEAPPFARLLAVAANLLCLHAAVAGTAFLTSACSTRRGRAVTVVFAIVLLAFFVQVLAQFWPPAEAFAWLGFMHYYRPHSVLQGGGWPLADMAVLGGTGLGLWAVGGVVFARRDIVTT